MSLRFWRAFRKASPIESTTYPTPATRTRIDDEPPVPRAAWNVAQRIKDDYERLKPIPPKTALTLREELNPSGKMVTNWRKILEHDAIVAMHHRLSNLDPDGYGAGRIDSFTGVGPRITGSASERALRLFQEMQGMARYARSRRLGRRYPWTREWRTPPAGGHEYGDRIQFHGTPSNWSGPYDPKKLRPQDQPFEYGPIGHYSAEQEMSAAGYQSPNIIERQGKPMAFDEKGKAVQRWQMPLRHERLLRFFPTAASAGGNSYPMPPVVVDRIQKWFHDMYMRHLGYIPNNLHIFSFDPFDKNASRYTEKLFSYIDVAALSRYLTGRYGFHVNKIHDLRNHLQTMALTAAGYDGSRSIDIDRLERMFEEPHNDEGTIYSLMPVAWNKARRVRDVPQDSRGEDDSPTDLTRVRVSDWRSGKKRTSDDIYPRDDRYIMSAQEKKRWEDSIRKLRRSIQIALFFEQSLRKAIRRDGKGLSFYKLHNPESLEASMEPGKIYGLYIDTDGNEKTIPITDPDTLSVWRDQIPGKIDLTGFFGKKGLLQFIGTMSRKSEAMAYHPTSSGVTRLVHKKIIDPTKNLHIGWLEGGKDESGEIGEDRIDHPDTQQQLFNALHGLGIKTITSDPTSFSRAKLFAKVTDKFHKQSGGLHHEPTSIVKKNDYDAVYD